MEQFDCDVLLRFESSSLVRERIIGTDDSENFEMPVAAAADWMLYTQEAGGMNYRASWAPVSDGMQDRQSISRKFDCWVGTISTRCSRSTNSNYTDHRTVGRALNMGPVLMRGKIGYADSIALACLELSNLAWHVQHHVMYERTFRRFFCAIRTT